LRNHWTTNINIYRRINNSIEIILDYTAGKDLVLFDVIADGLPAAVVPYNRDNQINLPAIFMGGDGSNKRIDVVAITTSGQLILGGDLKFKERVVVNAVYVCSGN